MRKVSHFSPPGWKYAVSSSLLFVLSWVTFKVKHCSASTSFCPGPPLFPALFLSPLIVPFSPPSFESTHSSASLRCSVILTGADKTWKKCHHAEITSGSLRIREAQPTFVFTLREAQVTFNRHTFSQVNGFCDFIFLPPTQNDRNGVRPQKKPRYPVCFALSQTAERRATAVNLEPLTGRQSGNYSYHSQWMLEFFRSGWNF